MAKKLSRLLIGIWSVLTLTQAEAQDGTSVESSTSQSLETATPSAPQAENNAAVTTDAPSLSWLANRRRPGAFVGFGLARPVKLGEFNHYEVLYGKKETEFNFIAGYYLYSYLFDFGLGTNIGYYNARGNPAKTIPGQSVPVAGDLPAGTTVDTAQEIELTLIPVQFLAHAALSPFSSRRLVFRAWGGLEQLYVKEGLKPKLPGDAGAGAGGKSFSNQGWNSGIVFGAMLSISLTGLEPRSDYALQSLGIDRTFISPFLEIVKTNDAKMGNFDRRTYGIAFNFESLR